VPCPVTRQACCRFATRITCRSPPSSCETSFRKLMASDGYVVLRNVPEEFDPVGLCSELGEFIAQYTGVLVNCLRGLRELPVLVQSD
jgi:hypothetical protein